MLQDPRLDVPRRLPVWVALSDLFLDTRHDVEDLRRLAKRLADSAYTLDDLEKILLWEVYPACRSNLRSIAGEWAGLGPGWLAERILRGPSAFMQAWAGTLGRWSVFCSRDWRLIKTAVRHFRESPGDATRTGGHHRDGSEPHGGKDVERGATVADVW